MYLQQSKRAELLAVVSNSQKRIRIRTQASGISPQWTAAISPIQLSSLDALVYTASLRHCLSVWLDERATLTPCITRLLVRVCARYVCLNQTEKYLIN
ncbi:unnamed protein product [Ceratitis capitata]|uniref:(Mediterranean fruit fly) hypothetical protein n=1 Tax=Ceratitis capitata TaxID=7213 RepID=A0A811UJC0_CERCA|nr:unnamed protein product [Ceratitis capitata]